MPVALSPSGEEFGSWEITEYVEPEGISYGARKELYGSTFMPLAGKYTVSGWKAPKMTLEESFST